MREQKRYRSYAQYPRNDYGQSHTLERNVGFGTKLQVLSLRSISYHIKRNKGILTSQMHEDDY